jgi:hypothetical protein
MTAHALAGRWQAGDVASACARMTVQAGGACGDVLPMPVNQGLWWCSEGAREEEHAAYDEDSQQHQTGPKSGRQARVLPD